MLSKPIARHLWLLLFAVWCDFILANQVLNFSVAEEQSSGVLVGSVGPGSNFILFPDNVFPFTVSSTGELRTKRKLNREQGDTKFQLLVQKMNNGIPTDLTVMVQVLDINDNIPNFHAKVETIKIGESTQIGHKLTLSPATDPDFGNNGTVDYRFVSGNTGEHFSLRSTVIDGTSSLDLVVNKTLDRETVSTYALNLSACDNGYPRLCDFCLINIILLDANDNAPVFAPTRYAGNITENSRVGTSIVRVFASDPDLGSNAKITFSVDTTTDTNRLFGIHPSDGIIVNNVVLNYEEAKQYNIIVKATDSGTPSKHNIAHVKIYVLDMNDNAPTMTIHYSNPGSYQVTENSPLGKNVTTLIVCDADSGVNSEVDVSLSNGNEYFSVSKTSGNNKKCSVYLTSVKKRIDRETTPQIALTYIATDRGNPPKSTRKAITLNIGDVNDNAPQFVNAPYATDVNESVPVTRSIFKVTASDRDLGSNAKISYHIINHGQYSSWFRIDSSSGVIFGTNNIDREKSALAVVTVNAKDFGVPSKDTNTTITFNILDANDNAPYFLKSNYVFTASENTTVTQNLGFVKASDKDTGIFKKISYSVKGSNQFRIDKSTGEITTSSKFDRESRAQLAFFVIATDIGGLQGNASVQVNIQDINDNNPYFPKTFYNLSVHENTPVGVPVVYITAKDDDAGDNAKIIYELRSCDPCMVFRIENTTGGLIPDYKLDHNRKNLYKFVVSGRDLKGLTAVNSASVNIHILPPINAPPKFLSNIYTFNILENEPVGSFVGQVVARRDKFGVGEFFDYTFVTGNEKLSFAINRSGIIVTNKVIDYEDIRNYTFIVQAKVSGTNLTARTTVRIYISDVNDNVPTFNITLKTVQLKEGVPLGYSVYTVFAEDGDSGSNGVVSYSFKNQSQHFVINSSTGVISTKSLIDYEMIRNFELNITAVDHGVPRNEASLLLRIIVLDVNDNPPQFSRSSYFVNVAENANIGFHFFTMSVSDVDSGRNGEFILVFKNNPYSNMFSLSNNGQVKVAKTLDRERKPDYSFTVIAKDQGYPQHTRQAMLTIIITDVNDNKPSFGLASYFFSVCEEQPPGTFIKAVTAIDRDEGSNGLVSYKLQPKSQYFEINSVTGAIKTKVKFDRETSEQIYNIFVNATDGGSPTESSIVEVKISLCDINDNAPVFSSNSPYTVNILKNVAINTNILHVQATDTDLGSSSSLEYSLLGTFSDEKESVKKFSIDRISGWIKTRSNFQADNKFLHSFSVVVKDKGMPQRINIQKVLVFLLEGNGQPSVFSSYDKTLIIPEDTVINSTILTVSVATSSQGSGKLWEYSISSGNTASSFKINRTTGVLKVSSPLSYESIKCFQLKIQALDRHRIDSRVGYMYVNVYLLDRNQRWPVFSSNPIIHAVYENLGVGSLVYQAVATDADLEDNGRIVYSLLSQGPGKPVFNIEPFTGKIKTTKALDREKVAEWTLIIKAEDTAVNLLQRHSTTTTMKILVFDINDNKPQFLSNNYTYMMEDERIGYPVMRVVAKDSDQGSNAMITYSITAGNELGKFRIDRLNGQITLIKKLTYNEQPTYTLNILAADNGRPSLSNALSLKIEIIDVNNNSPKFIKRLFTASINENSVIGTSVFQVRATDLDSGTNGKIKYSLETNSHFIIDSNTGVISTKAEIDREQWAAYKLSLSADNIAWPYHSDTSIIEINVNDVNDCPPVFIDGATINLTVFENLGTTLVHRFVASDCDTGVNAIVQYSITKAESNTFSLEAKSGFLYTTRGLDREQKAMYEIEVQARNTQPPYQFAKQIAYIFVGDLNDNSPVFTGTTYRTTIPENLSLNSTVFNISATDNDAGLNGKVVYSIVRNNSVIPFEINAVNGKLYVNSELDYESQKQYVFKVRASDLAPYGKRHSLKTITVDISDINDNAPVFTSPIFEGNTTDSIYVLATDRDSGLNGQLRYRFVQSSTMFSIHASTGEVTFQNPTVGRYKLRIEAYDQGTPSLSSYTTLIINVGSYSLLIPKFLNKSASVRIPENSPENFRVAKMVARSSSSRIRYNIELSQVNSGLKAAFKIDETSGILYVNNPVLLDYERIKSFEVVIRASVNGNDTLSTYEKLRVNLTDVNDNAPVIYPKNGDISLPEAVEGENQAMTVVKQFTASDADSGVNGEVVSFSIVSGNEDDVFRIHSGILVLNKNLDFERKRVHRLEIQARDGGIPPKYRTTRLTVHVIDKNDNAPIFDNYRTQKVSEAARPGLLICIVKARDPDKSSTVTYSLKPDGKTELVFYIDPAQGLIKLLQKLDFERIKQYRLSIIASDGKHSTNMTLVVDVEDSNDNAPVFNQPGYVVYLPEIIQPNQVIVKLNATDKDSGSFGTVKYSIPYPPIDAFLIDQNTGVITATRRFVLNSRNPPPELLVFASDGGQPPLQTQTRVHLRIKDPNYNGPKFDAKVYPKTRRIFEDTPIGGFIETVSVTDESRVPGMQIEYSIEAGNKDGKFYIDPLYGKIQLVNTLDRENVSRYTLMVRATDRGTPPQFANTSVTVIVVDANDNHPVFEKKKYQVSVMEDISQGTVLLTVNATDADDRDPRIGNGIIGKYEISSGNSLNWFEINSKGVITLIRLLDRESKSVHRLTVTATDNGQPRALTGFTSVVIRLIDVNDNRPEFTIPNLKDLKVPENSKSGTYVFKAIAIDRDQGDNGLVTYSIIDGDGMDYFYIHNATGWVRTKNKLIDYESKNLYKLRILAVDHGKKPLSSSFEYRVAVEDVNEFAPQFVKKNYAFSVRGDIKVGTKIGQVNATDKDGGSWSKIRYLLPGTTNSNEIRITPFTGEVFINSDLRKRNNRRRKRRSTDSSGSGVLSFYITADNGPNTTTSVVPVKLTVDYSCPGCKYIPSAKSTSDSSKTTQLILVITFGTIIALLLVCIIIIFMRWQRRKPNNDRQKETHANMQQDTSDKHDGAQLPSPESDTVVTDVIDKFHPGLFKQPSAASSGRGSSESQLLNGSHRPSFTATDNGSTHSFVVYHDKPVLDSGIVGDFDRLSDVTISDIAPSSEMHYGHKAEVASSVGSSFGRKHDVSSSLSRKFRKGIASSTQSESHDSLNDFMDEGGGEEAGRLDFGNLLYTKLAEVDADEQEAVMDGTRPFTDEGIPSRGGSLSTIVGSEEELRGSYNWDYLLDWGPQFQPLATVFSEIAKMDGNKSSEPSSSHMHRIAQMKMHHRSVNINNTSTENNQIPLQTLHTKPSQIEAANLKECSLKGNNPRDVNHSNLISNRTSMLSSFSSLPRSPMSAQSSYTSGPLSPNFTPAITPLITRSPSVSPLDTPGLGSPLGSKPESVLDIAEKSRKTKHFSRTRRREQTASSDRSSEVEIAV